MPYTVHQIKFFAEQLIGIISHVTGLDEKIGYKIVVTKDRTGGSRAEIILN